MELSGKQAGNQDPVVGQRLEQESAAPFAAINPQGDGEDIAGPGWVRGPGNMGTADGTPAQQVMTAAGHRQPSGDVPSSPHWRTVVDPADVMSRLVERAVLTVKGGRSEMRLVLKPAFLGQVRMAVFTANQHVTIRIVAETLMAKDLIEDNLNLLKAELQNQGLHVDDFDVTTSQDPLREEPQAKYQRAFRPGPRPDGKADRDGTPEHSDQKTPGDPDAGGSGRIDYFA